MFMIQKAEESVLNEPLVRRNLQLKLPSLGCGMVK